jgi:hypothetical protein
VGFWPSLAVEVIGGAVTAALLALVVGLYGGAALIRAHDAQVEDLDEDTRRWFRDRDARTEVEKARSSAELNRQNLFHSGQWLLTMATHQRAALTEYRDEMSLKRRRYRQLREAEGRFHRWLRERMGRPFARFALTDDQLAVLAKWRAKVEPSHMPNDSMAVDDPTSEEHEPALRRFERDGDPPL